MICKRFTEYELIHYLEMANIAMTNIADSVADQMDLSDEEMERLRENLQNYLNNTEETNAQSISES